MIDQLEIDERAAAVDVVHAATAIYTAGPIVADMLEKIDWPARGGRLLDPSAGDGSFLIGALKRLNIGTDDQVTAERVRGWEIHPGAVHDARTRIVAFLIDRGWTPAIAQEAGRDMVVECDFLDEHPEDASGFSIIAGNPPYLRLTGLPRYFQEFYEPRVPKRARGDLLNAFLDKCSEILPDDGVIALVTSDRWISNLSCGDLRASMGRRLGVSHLERLDVTTCFYRPKNRRRGQPPRIHPILVILESAGKAVQPLTTDAIRLGGAEEDTGMVFEQIASVRLAPWLGAKGVFVVDAATAAKFKGADLIPAVDVDDIPPDRDILTPPTRFAIRTQKDVEPTGALKRHLQDGFKRMSERARRRGIYWLPPESITLPLFGPRLLVPRIARRIRVIDLPEGILPVDHNIQIAVPAGGISLDFVRNVLLSKECDRWIRNNAPRLENGFLSITTTLLRRMPVPVRFVAMLPKATGTEG